MTVHQCIGTTVQMHRCRNRIKKRGGNCGQCGAHFAIRGVSGWDWADTALSGAPSDAVLQATANTKSSTPNPGSGAQQARIVALEALRDAANTTLANGERRLARRILRDINADNLADEHRAALGQIPDDTWSRGDSSVRLAAAAIATRPGLIDTLANDRSPNVRGRLATRSDVPTAVLLRLAADKHSQVRNNALETLATI